MTIKEEAKHRAETTMALKDVHLDKMTKEDFIKKHRRGNIMLVHDFESDLDELLRETAEVQRLSDIEAARKWIEHPALQGKSINFPLVTSPNRG